MPNETPFLVLSLLRMRIGCIHPCRGIRGISGRSGTKNKDMANIRFAEPRGNQRDSKGSQYHRRFRWSGVQLASGLCSIPSHRNANAQGPRCCSIVQIQKNRLRLRECRHHCVGQRSFCPCGLPRGTRGRRFSGGGGEELPLPSASEPTATSTGIVPFSVLRMAVPENRVPLQPQAIIVVRPLSPSRSDRSPLICAPVGPAGTGRRTLALPYLGGQSKRFIGI